MTVSAPLDQPDTRSRLHRFAMETATAAMVTEQASLIAQKAGHTSRPGAKHLTITSAADDSGMVTAEVESVYDGETLTVVVLIRRASEHYSEIAATITVTCEEFNHDWEDEFEAAIGLLAAG